jgi:hypothetical protein
MDTDADVMTDNKDWSDDSQVQKSKCIDSLMAPVPAGT